MQVQDLLNKNNQTVVVCRLGTSIVEAARALSKASIGAMPVLNENDTLVGIVSERDIVNGLAKHGEITPKLMLDEIMTSDVITIAPDAAPSHAMQLMSEHKIRHLPVLDSEDAVIGVISIRDVLNVTISKALQKSKQLRNL